MKVSAIKTSAEVFLPGARIFRQESDVHVRGGVRPSRLKASSEGPGRGPFDRLRRALKALLSTTES
jgi:hypothetical protein